MRGKFPLLCWSFGPGVCSLVFWFRICGYGLHFSTRPKSMAFFSERYGYRKALYLLKLRIEVLKP